MNMENNSNQFNEHNTHNDKKEFLQLPPLPIELDTKVVALLWTLSKLPEDVQDRLIEDVQSLHAQIMNGDDTENIMQDTDILHHVSEERIKPFYEMMQRIIKQIMNESVRLASWVYREYKVNDLSVEEMKVKMPDAAEYIEAMTAILEQME